MNLERVHWHDSFSVGVFGIDEQHRKLFDLLDRLIQAVEEGYETMVLEEIFTEAVNYTKIHFTSEEALFREHPTYGSHRAEHKGFVEDLVRLRASTMLGEKTQAQQLLEFLTCWLKKHILSTDISTFNQMGFRGLEISSGYEERLRMIALKPRILVVEDSPLERRVMKRFLDKAGFRVLEAGSGRQGMRMLEKTSDIHLVVTDLEMEDGSGFDLIRAIRERFFSSVYVMVVTGVAKKEALLEAFRLGANDFLNKPVMLEELLLRVQNGMSLMRMDSQEELIFAMAKLSDSRSPETGQHLERVQHYTRVLGLDVAASCPELQLSESSALEISRFSPLHDIGKVAIPDAILNKPGRLTPQEFEVMKDHARIGGDLIGKIITKTGSRSLNIAYSLTMHHHERWDGSGYPMQLAGENIPLPARITALADVYDALTSTRSYKSACNRDEAREIVLTASNQHFDPRIVQAFGRIESHFHSIREELADY